MVDNFEKIMSLLEFPTEDTFYHLQILKRKKEHPGMGSNSYLVKTYYIKSSDHLDKVGPEIVCLCEFHNARAYINLTPRSFEQLAYQHLKKVTDQILNKDFKSSHTAYNSVCGEYGTKPKRWIIDIDVSGGEGEKLMNKVMDFIESECQPFDGPKYVAQIPTKNGFHLITKPFDKSKFKNTFPEIDIHSNNPTVLFSM